jgi:hypothetical protein
MSATFIGLNLAKSVFQIHGVDAHGKVVVTKRLRREAVLAFSREGRGSAFTGPTSTCQLVHPASLQQRPFVGYYLLVFATEDQNERPLHSKTFSHRDLPSGSERADRLCSHGVVHDYRQCAGSGYRLLPLANERPV